MLAPKEYTERIALLDLAKAEGLDADQVAEFLWLVNARPDLAGLGAVIRNLAEALKFASGLWPSVLQEFEIPWLQRLLSDLEQLFAAGLCYPPAPSNEGRLSTTFDWSTRNPMYDALGSFRPAQDALYRRFRLLQAHIFFAHVDVMRKNSATSKDLYEQYGEKPEWPVLKISAQHAGLALRGFAEPSAWADDLLRRMEVLSPPQTFAGLPPVTVQRFNRKHQKSWTEDRSRYIAHYISQAYGIRLRSAGHGSAGRSFDPFVGDLEDPCFDFGEWSDWDSEMDDFENGENAIDDRRTSASADDVSSANEPPATSPDPKDESSKDSSHAFPPAEREARQAEQLLADNCPDEEDMDEDSLEGWRSNEPAYQNSPGSLSGGLRTLSNQVIRAGKHFAFAYERLSPSELKVIGETCDVRGIFAHLEYLNEHRRLSLKDLRERGKEVLIRGTGLAIDTRAEVLLFLHIMFWTGSTPQRTHSLRRVQTATGDHFSELEIDNKTIRMQVPFPRYRQVQKQAPDFDCNRRTVLALPDLVHLASRVDRFSRWRGSNDDPSIVFRRELTFYLTNARELLRILDPSERLTVSKISNELHGRIMSATGNDAVAAAMITGKVDRSARVPMFYACRSQARLQDIYERAVRALNKAFYEV